jgi:hypothetical protein
MPSNKSFETDAAKKRDAAQLRPLGLTEHNRTVKLEQRALSTMFTRINVNISHTKLIEMAIINNDGQAQVEQPCYPGQRATPPMRYA